jgi:signal transduction histidine kinase
VRQLAPFPEFFRTPAVSRTLALVALCAAIGGVVAWIALQFPLFEGIANRRELTGVAIAIAVACALASSYLRYTYLYEGLTVRRVFSVTLICAASVGAVVWLFLNTYLDLLVTALCVGYTSMILFTIAGNVRRAGAPREVVQMLAVVVGSVLGTILSGIVKGRTFSSMFSERLSGVAISMGLGIGFGCVVVATIILREKNARDQARIHRAESERHQLEKNVLEARLQLMQAQVEPHFLFNTLANVQHLVETDPAAATRMLDSLIHYLRAALPQMREGTTNLGRELDMARAFLEIQRVRMGSRLDFEIQVPEPLKGHAFPPMMLISLVENAVKHGVDPCCESGSIIIRAEETEGRLKVSVSDTGEGIVPKKGGGVGLTNIRERLKALYGASARLVLEENAPRGVVASIEVPVGIAA